MGWLRQLTRKYPAPADWPRIFQVLCDGFAVSRVRWFAACVQVLEGWCSGTEPEASNAQIAAASPMRSGQQKDRFNRELNGKLLLLLKAFQFQDVPAFIEANKYLESSQITRFTRAFALHFAGTEPIEIVECIGHFSSMPNDGCRDSRFCRYVAEHVMGIDDPRSRFYGLLMSNLLTPFAWTNKFIVAAAFGDRKTAGKLLKMVQDFPNIIAGAHQAVTEDTPAPMPAT